jgi:hypothetical protein
MPAKKAIRDVRPAAGASSSSAVLGERDPQRIATIMSRLQQSSPRHLATGFREVRKVRWPEPSRPVPARALSPLRI